MKTNLLVFKNYLRQAMDTKYLLHLVLNIPNFVQQLQATLHHIGMTLPNNAIRALQIALHV